MAEKKEKTIAEYYKVGAGFTTALGVAQEGQIVRGEDMVPGGVEWEPMSVEDQQVHFGRVLYEEYTPEEGDVIKGDEPAGPGAIGDSPIGNEEEMDQQREELPETMVDKPEESKPRSRATSTSESRTERAGSEPTPPTTHRQQEPPSRRT